MDVSQTKDESGGRQVEDEEDQNMLMTKKILFIMLWLL
jgi:hypothetical protein